MGTCLRCGRRSPVAEHTLQREMTISHREFHRLLPAAVPGYQINGAGTIAIRVQRPEHNQLLEIALGTERQRTLGALKLPVTDVRLRFSGFSETEFEAFLRRFDMAYQRGGG